MEPKRHLNIAHAKRKQRLPQYSVGAADDGGRVIESSATENISATPGVTLIIIVHKAKNQ